MKKNPYSNLNQTNFDNKYDWKNNMLRKSLPPRAYYNEFTGGFLDSLQKILSMGFDPVKIIKKYFKF